MTTQTSSKAKPANPDEKSVFFKCPGDLRDAFKASCAANDQTSSQVIREFMRRYVAKNGQGSLL